jgi:hypothetical protein
MFPYQRAIALGFGLVGFLLLFLIVKIYQAQKPPLEGDDTGRIVSLVSTVTVIDSSNYKVAEELFFSLKKPVQQMTRIFPTTIAHTLGVQTQKVSFEKALEIKTFNDIELIQKENSVILKYPFQGDGGYRLDFSVNSPSIVINELPTFYFKQVHDFPLSVPAGKIIIKFPEKPAEVKGFIETAEKRAMIGTTDSGRQIEAYIPIVDEKGAQVVETEFGYYEITNTRILLPGESLAVIAVL